MCSKADTEVSCRSAHYSVRCADIEGDLSVTTGDVLTAKHVMIERVHEAVDCLS